MEFVEITNEFIVSGMSGNGGFNYAQLELLGVETPPKHGWKDEIIGKRISKDIAQKFLDMKGKTKRKAKTCFSENTLFDEVNEEILFSDCNIENLKNTISFDDMKKQSEKIIVYTDGGCHGNPGVGGWACIVIAEGEARELSGGEKLTTNNRMELTAAISALSAIYNTERFRSCLVQINTDSQYVKNGITSWIHNWKKNDWKTSTKKPVLNKELWKNLDEFNNLLNVEWNWVKGHAGIAYNERCDELCQIEMKKFE